MEGLAGAGLSCVGAIIAALPNLFSAERLRSMPGWFPHEPDQSRARPPGRLASAARGRPRGARAGAAREPVETQSATRSARRADRLHRASRSGAGADVGRDPRRRPGRARRANSSPSGRPHRRRRGSAPLGHRHASPSRPLTEQSRSACRRPVVEIVRRRIDETGTKEPTIQRQGADRILVQVPGDRRPGAT